MKITNRILLLSLVVFFSLWFVWPSIAQAVCCECVPPLYTPNGELQRTCALVGENRACEEVCQNYGPPPDYPYSADFCDSNNCPKQIVGQGCCAWVSQDNKVTCSENISSLDCKNAVNSNVKYRGFVFYECNTLEYCKEGYEFPSDIKPEGTEPKPGEPGIEFKPHVTIPGKITIGGKEISFSKGQPVEITGNTAAQYFVLFYRFFVVALVIIAVVVVMWGGFKRIMAAGSPERIKSANETIIGAITGVVIALISYSLLSLINPALVSFKTLEIYQVKAEYFSVRPGFIKNPGAAKLADEYKMMSCPSQAELLAGVQFYTTGYYKPNWNEKEGYQSFWCNIAMNCWCPNNNAREKEASCKVTGQKPWSPWKYFGPEVPYCTTTSPPPRVPEAWHTAAVSTCLLPKGTVFKVFGSNQPGVDTAVWYAEDSGSWITGRRVDLFFGQGPTAYQQAVRNTGVVTIKICPNNDRTQCPSS